MTFIDCFVSDIKVSFDYCWENACGNDIEFGDFFLFIHQHCY